MRRCLLLIAACWLLTGPLQACAYELLILQSSRAPAYDELLKGVRSVRKFSERVIVLADYAEVDLQRIVREERPRVILALGENAFEAARRVRQLPVVVLMAHGFRSHMPGHPAMTGVEVMPPVEQYLAMFQTLKARRVGVVVNPARSGHLVRRAQQVASRYGVELAVREVTSPREVSGQLTALGDAVDALWLLPDATAVARETVDAYFRFSMSRQVPVVAFSGAYLQAGAAVAIEADRHDTGRRGGEMAAELLDGEDISGCPPVLPRKTTIGSNPVVLRRLGLTLPGRE